MVKKTQVSLVYMLLFFISFSCTTKSEGEKTKDTNSSTEKDTETIVVEPVPIVSATIVSVYGRLQVQGNKIVDKNNEVIQLRGMSLFWSQWMGQYYTPEVVAWLKKDWQVTVVRAAMGVEDFDGYLTSPKIEKQKVFTVIDAAIELGIYVIVDWHSHHAEDHLEEAKTFFTEVAQKYGDQPNIIYELYNEPLDVSWNTVLKPYHEAVLAEIRQYDSDNLVICGTSNWSQDIDDVVGNEIADENIGNRCASD
jgi:endoglucanase